MSSPAEQTLVVEPNAFGGRLVYYAKPADPAYWDELWSSRDGLVDYTRFENGHLPRFLHKTFLRYVHPGALVLEAGCGMGWFTVAARARGYQAVGIDYAPRVIQRLNDRYPNLSFSVGDVRSMIDTPDNAYDAVYSPGVCEHFRDGPDAVLREAARILSPGGYLIISVPCFNPFRKFLHRLGVFESPRDFGNLEFYQYAFSSHEFHALVKAAGMEVVESVPHGVWHTLKSHISVLAKISVSQVERYLAGILDELPLVKAWGHTMVYVCRKPITEAR